MESTNDAVYILDLEGNFTLVNQKITELTGYSSEELLGFPFSVIFSPEHSRNIKTFFWATLSHGVAITQYDTELVRKDSTRQVISLDLTPLFVQGKISAIVCTAEALAWHHRPLLPQKQEDELASNLALEYEVQERALQLQQALDFEARLKRITDKVRDSLDEHQIVQVVVKELALGLNIGCCNMALYDREKDTSTICYEHAVSIPASQGRVSRMSSFPELYNQLLQNQYFQFCSLLPHPQRGRVAMLACPVADDRGVMGDLWLVNQQYHTFSELEIRLVQQVSNQCAIAIRQARLYQASLAQVQKLERLNQLKDNFISTISHELRTPITKMILATHLLEKAQSTERQQSYLEILKAECAREARLIDDLLDLQHLDEISCESVGLNLYQWIPKIIESLDYRNSKLQQIRVELPLNLPTLRCDPTLLERILAELLNNACKYTPPAGEISLSVCYEQLSATSDRVPMTIFTVTNQAEIPATELPYIFEDFYRASNATLVEGGTGLGLALVQRLAQRLAATVQAESGSGWTTFTVRLPDELPTISS